MAQTSNNNNFSEPNFRFGLALIGLLIVVLIILGTVYIIRGRQSSGGEDTTATESFFERIFGGSDDSNLTAEDDVDRDGLKDDEEVKAGTDVARSDTDSDGLTDREEILVYQTDPKNADSDGDGVKDGDEIKQRRDPKDPRPSAQWPPRPAEFSAANN